jgi:L-lactate dehydrogenase complex protein LldG
MTAAREAILARVREALADVPAGERPEDVPVARDYRTEDDGDRVARLTEFQEKLEDYDALVHRTDANGVAALVAERCRAAGAARVVVPPGLPAAWRPEGVEVTEDAGLSAAELDAVETVVTGCAAAIAQTGTLVLDGRELSGRRALTLVPDHHVCVVEAGQVAGLVPAALARVGPAVREEGAPITLVSGPSATSDIELSRVEGVHGPRNLHVIVVGSDPSADTVRS